MNIEGERERGETRRKNDLTKVRSHFTLLIDKQSETVEQNVTVFEGRVSMKSEFEGGQDVKLSSRWSDIEWSGEYVFTESSH